MPLLEIGGAAGEAETYSWSGNTKVAGTSLSLSENVLLLLR